MMWAITSYFNPIRYKRRLSNYRIFRANLCVPLVTVELSFDGQFELTKNDADILIQISGGAVLWQKERLLNIALKALPSGVENFTWLDCDILFKRSDWAAEAERLLNDRFSAVQLFSKAIYLNKDDTGESLNNDGSYREASSLLSFYNGDDTSPLNTRAVSAQGDIVYNPGLAWAAKREIFAKHGFYDLAIVGGGDLYMANSVFGTTDAIVKKHLFNDATIESYLQWAQPFHRTMAGRVGHVPGEIHHLWHGDLVNRNYRNRFQLLADFNPQTDVYVGDNGVLYWTNSDGALAQALRAHFLNRREDG